MEDTIKSVYTFKMYRRLTDLCITSLQNYCEKYNLSFNISVKKRFLLKSIITFTVKGPERKISILEYQLSLLLKYVI